MNIMANILLIIEDLFLNNMFFKYWYYNCSIINKANFSLPHSKTNNCNKIALERKGIEIKYFQFLDAENYSIKKKNYNFFPFLFKETNSTELTKGKMGPGNKREVQKGLTWTGKKYYNSA